MRKESRIIQLLSILSLLLFLHGCATTWQPTNGIAQSYKKAYSANLPSGWIFRTSSYEDSMELTRDGLPLQAIRIYRHELSEPLPLSEKTIDARIGPEQLAEALLSESKSNTALANVAMTSLAPISIDGTDGSLIEYSFSNASGLKYSVSLAAIIKGEFLYLFDYTAPQRHYFEKDYQAFQEVLSSVQIQ